MENIKKDEWLHEEFGIKVNNRYVCIRKNEDRIVGQILNFSPRSNIAIKCEDGLHIIPYKEILELRPLIVKNKTTFKVGDVVRVVEDIEGYGLAHDITDRVKVNQGSVFVIAQIQKDIVTDEPIINLYSHDKYPIISLYNPKLEFIKRGII